MSQRACETCRKRKKRCTHTENVVRLEEVQSRQEDQFESPFTPLRSPPTTTSGPQMRSIDSMVPLSCVAHENEHQTLTSPHSNTTAEAGTGIRNRDLGDDPHFIGDLNPEGVFLADTSPTNTAGSVEDSAGIWLQRRVPDETASQMLRIPSNHPYLSLIHSPNPLISKVLLPHLEDECLRILPSQADFQALMSIYVNQVHPLFPVLDITNSSFSQHHSTVHAFIKQAICLAASPSPAARSHLSLQSEDGKWCLRSQQEFATQISLALRASIDLGLIGDKIVLIQVLSLLSLFTQLSDVRHTSAEVAARAVSHVHTTGLHLNTENNRKDHESVTRLFCCVWALDRLNAAFHGRPVLMHERDCGRDLETCFQQQEPTFRLFLQVVQLLDDVIALYRPGQDPSDGDWKGDFPSFEDLLSRSGAGRTSLNLIASVEVLYHAVSMLTCRSRKLKDVVRSSASYVRQTLSASAIISIVGNEFRGQLSILPILPYAVSLSLRYYYRELRLTKIPFTRARSRRQLLLTCGLLRELGKTFSAAMLMVRLAEQTVQEMDKIFSSILQAQPSQTAGSVTQSINDSSTRQSGQTATDNSEQRQTTLAEPSDNAEFSADTRPDEQFQDIDFEPDMFNLVPDLDIFDHFDPDFNLDAIDATLGDNIAPVFPYVLS